MILDNGHGGWGEEGMNDRVRCCLLSVGCEMGDLGCCQWVLRCAYEN